DACHQLRRYVFEAETTRVTRTEHIASVELATNLRHASDHDAAPLRGEAIGVVWGEQVIDRDTRNALQGLGHGAIRQRGDIDCRNGIDDLFGVAFDLLSGFDALANARDDDLI